VPFSVSSAKQEPLNAIQSSEQWMRCAKGTKINLVRLQKFYNGPHSIAECFRSGPVAVHQPCWRRNVGRLVAAIEQIGHLVVLNIWFGAAQWMVHDRFQPAENIAVGDCRVFNNITDRPLAGFLTMNPFRVCSTLASLDEARGHFFETVFSFELGSHAVASIELVLEHKALMSAIEMANMAVRDPQVGLVNSCSANPDFDKTPHMPNSDENSPYCMSNVDVRLRTIPCRTAAQAGMSDLGDLRPTHALAGSGQNAS